MPIGYHRRLSEEKRTSEGKPHRPSENEIKLAALEYFLEISQTEADLVKAMFNNQTVMGFKDAPDHIELGDADIEKLPKGDITLDRIAGVIQDLFSGLSEDECPSEYKAVGGILIFGKGNTERTRCYREQYPHLTAAQAMLVISAISRTSFYTNAEKAFRDYAQHESRTIDAGSMQKGEEGETFNVLLNKIAYEFPLQITASFFSLYPEQTPFLIRNNKIVINKRFQSYLENEISLLIARVRVEHARREALSAESTKASKGNLIAASLGLVREEAQAGVALRERSIAQGKAEIAGIAMGAVKQEIASIKKAMQEQDAQGGGALKLSEDALQRVRNLQKGHAKQAKTATIEAQIAALKAKESAEALKDTTASLRKASRKTVEAEEKREIAKTETLITALLNTARENLVKAEQTRQEAHKLLDELLACSEDKNATPEEKQKIQQTIDKAKKALKVAEENKRMARVTLEMAQQEAENKRRAATFSREALSNLAHEAAETAEKAACSVEAIPTEIEVIEALVRIIEAKDQETSASRRVAEHQKTVLSAKAEIDTFALGSEEKAAMGKAAEMAMEDAIRLSDEISESIKNQESQLKKLKEWVVAAKQKRLDSAESVEVLEKIAEAVVRETQAQVATLKLSVEQVVNDAKEVMKKAEPEMVLEAARTAARLAEDSVNEIDVKMQSLSTEIAEGVRKRIGIQLNRVLLSSKKAQDESKKVTAARENLEKMLETALAEEKRELEEKKTESENVDILEVSAQLPHVAGTTESMDTADKPRYVEMEGGLLPLEWLQYAVTQVKALELNAIDHAKRAADVAAQAQQAVNTIPAEEKLDNESDQEQEALLPQDQAPEEPTTKHKIVLPIIFFSITAIILSFLFFGVIPGVLVFVKLALYTKVLLTVGTALIGFGMALLLSNASPTIKKVSLYVLLGGITIVFAVGLLFGWIPGAPALLLGATLFQKIGLIIELAMVPALLSEMVMAAHRRPELVLPIVFCIIAAIVLGLLFFGVIPGASALVKLTLYTKVFLDASTVLVGLGLGLLCSDVSPTAKRMGSYVLWVGLAVAFMIGFVSGLIPGAPAFLLSATFVEKIGVIVLVAAVPPILSETGVYLVARRSAGGVLESSEPPIVSPPSSSQNGAPIPKEEEKMPIQEVVEEAKEASVQAIESFESTYKDLVARRGFVHRGRSESVDYLTAGESASASRELFSKQVRIQSKDDLKQEPIARERTMSA